MKQFQVGEDSPVFPSLFSYCQVRSSQFKYIRKQLQEDIEIQEEEKSALLRLWPSCKSYKESHDN